MVSCSFVVLFQMSHPSQTWTFLNHQNEKKRWRASHVSVPSSYLSKVLMEDIRAELWKTSSDHCAQEVRLIPLRWILNVCASLLTAARPRPSQSDSRGGGHLPGVLRLGAADHAHADRKWTHTTHKHRSTHCLRTSKFTRLSVVHVSRMLTGHSPGPSVSLTPPFHWNHHQSS